MVAPKKIFFKAYVVHLAERKEWIGSLHVLFKQGVIWFTDGSKNKKGVGAEACRRGSKQEFVCSLEPFATFSKKDQSQCEGARAPFLDAG